jgi:hypothetical protein
VLPPAGDVAVGIRHGPVQLAVRRGPVGAASEVERAVGYEPGDGI